MRLVLRKYGKAMKARIAQKSKLWLRTVDGSLLCAPLMAARMYPYPFELLSRRSREDLFPLLSSWSPHVLDHNVGWFREELFNLAAIRGDPDTAPPRIELIFAGKPLEDHMTLRVCGLHVGSEVTLLKMPALLELHVFGMSVNQRRPGYLGMVRVEPGDTFDKFKANIQAKYDIPIEQQRIFWRGRLLNGEQTFTDYNILDGSTIRLVNTAED